MQSDERGGQRSDFVSFQTSSFPSSYRRAGNGHSACLQATPPQTEEAVQKFLWKKIFWKNGIRKCVDKAKNPRRVTVLSKARGWGRPPLGLFRNATGFGSLMFFDFVV
ncbi:MAG TPA: hypothetical protein VER26_10360 [Xanthobacteraceae bacterium]|nr:hypothetical protein [Xanthobacteraceae bacterium]